MQETARRVIRGVSIVVFVELVGCGGGGSGSSAMPPGGSPPPPATYSATSGVAQKGPLILGSAITAQELTATLSPNGKQYSYQTNSNLGTFNPNSTFTSQYIGVGATGYYFDEAANAVSSGTITLNGISDLSSDSVLNVNLLTTLAYQRVQSLVTKSGMTFTAARQQAEAEVLSAFNIRNVPQLSAFGTLDLSKGSDGDHILAAISSLFVYGNTSGNLAALMASAQSDIGTNGKLTNSSTMTALSTAAQSLDPSIISSNLTQQYASVGITFAPSDISDWIDQDGDNLVGHFKFAITNATESSSFSFPSAITDSYASSAVSISGGELSINGTPSVSPAMIKAGDVVSVAPAPGVFPGNAFTAYLLSGTTPIAKAMFVNTTSNIWTRAFGLPYTAAQPMSVVLQSGKILIVGGNNTANLASAAVYDPAVGSWLQAPSMSKPRVMGTATLLPNGKVLVTGGQNTVFESTTEIYDPVSNTWSPAASMSVSRMGHAAALLPNGTVLVIGGQGGGPPLATCEIYDPTTNSWTAAASMANARMSPVIATLANGKILVTGSPAEIYDPATGSWSGAGSMSVGREQESATLLQNGKVLVAGGGGGGPTLPAELYDPVSNSWSTTGPMNVPRSAHAATLMTNGQVIVTGGVDSMGTVVATAEVYDPTTNTWTPIASMRYNRAFHFASLLSDGALLVCAGDNYSAPPTAYMSSCETYW
jgi:hypothetical protein